MGCRSGGKREALRRRNALLLGAVVHQAASRNRLRNLHALILRARFHGSAERVGCSLQLGHGGINAILSFQAISLCGFCCFNSGIQRVGVGFRNPRALGRDVGAVLGDSGTR